MIRSVQNDSDSIKLTTKQVAALLGVSVTTLLTWRAKKIGPPYYRRVSRIFYLKSEIERWELSNPGL